MGVNQPKRLENVKILIANTSMDSDKIKVFGSKVRVDSTAKIAELELAEKVSGLPNTLCNGTTVMVLLF